MPGSSRRSGHIQRHHHPRRDRPPVDGKRSLREAITAANNLSGPDVIVLPAGVYKTARTGAGEDVNATGDFDVTGAVTLRGAGTGRTIVDGQQLDRVFDVFGTGPGTVAVVLQRLTVRNGNVPGQGGGIHFANADLVLRDVAVTGNRATESGGGISNGDAPGTGDVKVVRTSVARNVADQSGVGLHVIGASALNVINSTVRRNLAGNSGGGISAASTVTLSGCAISGNSAGIGSGGGINAATAALTNCSVTGNSAGSSRGGIPPVGVGGGIAANVATLTGCTVSGNTAGVEGGGINASTATLTGCTVSGNLAGSDGGGINAGTATLTNSTISGNSAWNAGGGVRTTTLAAVTNTTISHNSAGTLGGGIWAHGATLLNVTVVENSSGTGGGIFFDSRLGAFSVRNSLIALNLAGYSGTGPDLTGDFINSAFTSQGHNLIGDGTGGTGFTNGANGDIVGTAANPIDPKLGPLANNGGRTKTHALLAGSRAIDRGDSSILPPTDQRGGGFARNKDDNFDGIAIVDIGAFER